ncbi:zinc finger cw-type pwwp domain [Lynx pardinus]|uniref:Zinc finger cw-type pwwp domain n=1 Tax=Lynx pardinus TaxID=191816 RepID=A0A485MD27_LYNPA|nr:zinc finger CW-type PWWP domain protein 1 isoform X1 [Lynx canadensis]XP_030155829.1 zinc finger CW-type PWWP domain protein 1 isoform X1 [Lynx canadensis]XP_032447417.1 zinc finger CW-type PWWP domain protein 1 isoform X1 [Lynx canadensis]VFV18725.1 zinc finger cw-type pwwp domain [Lynx pardinus]
MMATLQSKEEHGKGSKKTFAPPVQKMHSLMCYSPNSPKEETLGISSSKDRLEKKEEKATTENGPSSGQEKKGKAKDKKAEKKAKEKLSLTNAEFEEIVQIVLRKSLQECLETSCAQPIRRTQLDKEPGIASSTDNDNADGEKVMVPHILEISATKEAGVTSVIETSKPGQPDPPPSEKKFNRFSLSKGKKGAQDEKMEKAQSGREPRQKAQLKKTVQNHSQIRNQQKGEGSGFGQCLVWVQCSSPNCEKWRRLCGNIDPSVLPDNWSCDQNTDLKYNRCDIPEESWIGHESDVAYASYIPGSIIWAKQYGYPWWPGMVESDPDLGEYFLFASHLDSLPSKYHVTFFGETVSRAWIPVNMLKNFQELSLELAGVKRCRNKDCSQKLGVALTMAQEAEQISIQERVNLFGFRSRYNGSDNSREGKDITVTGANSPDSRLEKEGEEAVLEEVEEEEEEEKDSTLPSPKPAKIQTKNPKARGIADGRDGILQSKTTKRSLGNESAATPVRIMGRKEGHRNSEPDQPGPKKKFKAPQSKAAGTNFPEDKEARMEPKGLPPPAHLGACPMVGKEGSKCPQEAGSVLHDDEASSDLDLEQLLEDVGEDPEQLEEPQCGDDPGEFTTTFFEE